MIYANKLKPRILVIGDLMIDHYLWGSSERISPEAPVPVININNESSTLGGAGNVLNNLYALGAKADILSVIGECEVSLELKSLLSLIEIDLKYLVIQKNRFTSKKTRVMSANQQVARYDIESAEEISNESQKSILKNFTKLVNEYDVILLSDYGKGVLTFELTQSLINISNANNKKIIVDPKGTDYSKYKDAFLLTPNKKEASEATNIAINDLESLTKALLNLKNQCNLKHSLITLSEEGVAILDEDLIIHPTQAKEVFDVTGAGDTVLASLGYALACGNNVNDSIKFANTASGVVVGKIGSATTTIDEIKNYESTNTKLTSNHFVKSWDQIKSIVSDLRSKEQKIVFTNGCFDILHLGHIKYLEKAKQLGDILILGLNSDNSIKKIKGKGRPIIPESDRAYIVASLEVVDYVVIFDEDTPLKLIQLIQPDILAKGDDYKGKKIVGDDIAKELKLIEFISGKSSSKIIDEILKK